MIKDGLVDIDDISVLKEAEKCASKLCCTDCKAVICEEKCECWNFAKKGAEFGYNKANEWHYVKDGDLPRQYEHTCFSIDVLANNKKWVYYEFSSGKWFCGNKEVNVIAWKEIVLPKEIEQND